MSTIVEECLFLADRVANHPTELPASLHKVLRDLVSFHREALEHARVLRTLKKTTRRLNTEERAFLREYRAFRRTTREKLRKNHDDLDILESKGVHHMLRRTRRLKMATAAPSSARP